MSRRYCTDRCVTALLCRPTCHGVTVPSACHRVTVPTGVSWSYYTDRCVMVLLYCRHTGVQGPWPWGLQNFCGLTMGGTWNRSSQVREGNRWESALRLSGTGCACRADLGQPARPSRGWDAVTPCPRLRSPCPGKDRHGGAPFTSAAAPCTAIDLWWVGGWVIGILLR